MIRVRVFLSQLLLITVILCLGAVVALVTYGIDDSPRSASELALTTEDIARAKFLIGKYDPRNLREREISRFTINGREANILLSYLIDRVGRSTPPFSGLSRIASQVKLMSEETAEVLFTVGLPKTPLGTYLNIGIVFMETTEKPVIHRITIGQISLKGRWMQPVLHLGEKLTQHLGITKELALVLGVVKTVRFHPDELTLVYEWRSAVAQTLAEKGRSLLITDQDRESLIAYNNQIVQTAGGIREREAPLIDFMAPVFALAQQRSEATDAPQVENRSALLALTMFVNNRPIAPLIGNHGGKAVPKPKRVNTTLSGRTDLPKHFMISAALAVLSDSNLSNMVGLFKEIDDSIGGSGFSFVDLLADRAGVRFAELATADDRKARWAQQTMARGINESDFMPNTSGLNEGLMQKTFKKRYRDMDSAAFHSEKEEIERRIDACPLFQIK